MDRYIGYQINYILCILIKIGIKSYDKNDIKSLFGVNICKPVASNLQEVQGKICLYNNYNSLLGKIAKTLGVIININDNQNQKTRVFRIDKENMGLAITSPKYKDTIATCNYIFFSILSVFTFFVIVLIFLFRMQRLKKKTEIERQANINKLKYTKYLLLAKNKQKIRNFEKENISLVTDYFIREIQDLNLNINILIDSNIKEALVNVLLIQKIIMNFMIESLYLLERNGIIEIKFYKHGEYLELYYSDNLCSIDIEAKEKVHRESLHWITSEELISELKVNKCIYMKTEVKYKKNELFIKFPIQNDTESQRSMHQDNVIELFSKK